MSRPRSASAHHKVLHAALELVAERGVEATSMDAIARQSGVSKATIYKHWEDKDSLLLEMLANLKAIHSRPRFDSGDVKADLVAVLSYRPSEDTALRERLMPQLAVYSAANAAFGDAWRQMVMEPPRREIRRLLKLGIQRDELSPELDIESSLTLLLGPLLYSHIFLKKGPADHKLLAEAVVDAFWRAFGLHRNLPSPKRSAEHLTLNP